MSNQSRGATLALSQQPSWVGADRLMAQRIMQRMQAPQPVNQEITQDALPSLPSPILPETPVTTLVNPQEVESVTGGLASLLQPRDSVTAGQFKISDHQSVVPTITEQGTATPKGAAMFGQDGEYIPPNPVTVGSIVIGNPDGTDKPEDSQVQRQSFKMSNDIKNELPQISPDQKEDTSAVSTPNSPQTPKTVSKPLAYMFEKIEGAAPSKESNGRTSRWGIGNNKDEITPTSMDQASKIFMEKYIDSPDTPHRKKIWNQLSDPRDVVAYSQGVLHRPAYMDEFTRAWKGKVGGDAWRQALLNYQTTQYAEREKGDQNYNGFLQRVNRARAYKPT